MRLQLLPRDLKLRLQILLEQLREVPHENEFVFPKLDQPLEHVDNVVVFNLSTAEKKTRENQRASQRQKNETENEKMQVFWPR